MATRSKIKPVIGRVRTGKEGDRPDQPRFGAGMIKFSELGMFNYVLIRHA